jgi:hypothetical protein
MGIGDRHSKRNAATKIPTVRSAALRPYELDDGELDDAFSAWDEDDALARKPDPASEVPRLAQATSSSLAQTRVERKPAVGTSPSVKMADALVDPVAMRDIVISRARTLDDPLTTRVLAEIARSEAPGERATVPQRARARIRTVRIAPFLPVAGTRPPVLSTTPAKPDTDDADDADDDVTATPRRRTTRRSIRMEKPVDPKK